ncbi:thiamine pyrophosphate-binding protein [Marivita geojedonensis]|uniref:Thiamine pyrophosphate-binding protein n=1 Tax=Marivita geojedonensis TaxID=1123756 RepID=A0A1X4NPK5_9RHOB|nr:thiamine pyrophosphate-binding protein [Marivita geojedonensis]OSQ52670.1 thiamine pyrophosphate-binding protein [Marivita geojedonensis]PRY80883.1 acetolactate synthase-1/2/3 large subunit [Marivita geojedonensis]
MTRTHPTIRAADLLVDQLVAQGTTAAFGVPGESYLPVLDAFYGRESDIRFVTCRQEGGAAMMADAYGKLTGRPGICFATRGPGATNASAGVHVAFQDSTPMILFLGQVARDMLDREAFQEIDYRRMFGQMAKWVAQIDDASRLQEYVSRAFRTAMSGRPGPVVLALPEDMLYDEIPRPKPPARVETPRFGPGHAALNAIRDRIAQAKSPLVMAGGGGWTSKGIAALQTFAETQGLPVSVSLRCQGLMDNRHPNYIGHYGVGTPPYLKDIMAETDLFIAIGPRLGEMTTAGYSLLSPPVPNLSLIHVFPEPEELGRVFEPEIAVAADTESFCEAVADWEPITPGTFTDRTTELRKQYETFSDPASVSGDPLAPLFAHLAGVLPENAIVCNGAGNYAAWLHRFYCYRAPGSQLAPTSGSMGYGLPAAIGAAICEPDREIFAIAGDGCFMMTCQEMATAAHHGLNLTVIIINNARYGTIRAHQEREYPDRVSGTALTNPDFCDFARSFGAHAERAGDIDRFAAVLAAARERGGLNLIEVPADPTYLAPGKRLE